MTLVAALASVIALLLGLALGLLATRARTAAALARADGAQSDVATASQRADGLLAQLRTAEQELAGTRAELAAERERAVGVAGDQERLVTQFRALSMEALEANTRNFLQIADRRLAEAQQLAAGDLEQRRVAVETLVAPLQVTLDKVAEQMRELETRRLTAYTSLTEQVRMVRESSEGLKTETTALVAALRAPQARGRWGEMQLRRVVEMAGMVEHCDFVEQASVTTADGVSRPDMVVRLAGGKSIIVDAKVSLAAYLQAAESADPDVATERMEAHARHLRTHVDQLAAKSYWSLLPNTPEFVVLFVPGEAFLAPALERDPALLEHAMGRKVMIATPTTLMAMLRTVAYSWQQQALTDNARQVFELGRELYERLATLGSHVDKLGRSIERVVGNYNAAVGSLETRVLVTARKIAELKVTDGELDAPVPVEDTPRALSHPALLDSASAARAVVALPVLDEAGERDETGAGTGIGTDLLDPRFGLDSAPQSGRDAAGA